MKERIDLLQGNIISTLFKLALPIMGTSLIQMAYNMTDMIWIGRIGSTAVTAIGTAGMYLWVAEGIAIIPKIGGQVRVAHALGANHLKSARDLVVTVLKLTMLLALTYSLILWIFNRQLIGFFNLNTAEVIANGENYLKIVAFGIVFTFLNYVMTGLLTASGDSKTPFKINTVGLVFNIILDPLLIFGIGFFPSLKVEGAAIATVLAQVVVTGLYVRHIYYDKYLFENINLRTKFRLNEAVYIAKVGFPAAMQTIAFSCIAMYISRFVATFGDDAIAVQRIGSQIESVSWMTAEGFAMAINTFIAQNYGAKNFQRATKGYTEALKLMSAWGFLTTSLLFWGANVIFYFFLPDLSLLAMGSSYLKILGLSQLFMCVEIMTSGAFAGFGNTTIPSFVGITLTFARIPGVMILTRFLGSIDGVWWAITISSILKGVILLIIFKFFVAKINKKALN